jgi:hypothetical protein
MIAKTTSNSIKVNDFEFWLDILGLLFKL